MSAIDVLDKAFEDRRCTLWGRAFDISTEDGKKEARAFLADEVDPLLWRYDLMLEETRDAVEALVKAEAEVQRLKAEARYQREACEIEKRAARLGVVDIEIAEAELGYAKEVIAALAGHFPWRRAPLVLDQQIYVERCLAGR